MMGSYVEARPQADPLLGFEARSEAWRLGPFLFNHARLPPCDLLRTPEQARRDALDHWVIALCREGRQVQRQSDIVTDMAPGIPYVFSAANAFVASRSGVAMDWVGLYFPRDALPQLNAALGRAMSGRPLTGPMVPAFSHFLSGLVETLPAVSANAAPHLATTIEALLSGICTDTGTPEAPDGMVALGQFATLRHIIRQNLGTASLSPARLSRAAGISRSQLYRLFAPYGGVASYIKSERLQTAYRQLADPAERRTIVDIAEAVGIFGASTFSRAFRQEFGCTPREVREAARAGLNSAASPRAFADGASLTAMLRTL